MSLLPSSEKKLIIIFSSKVFSAFPLFKCQNQHVSKAYEELGRTKLKITVVKTDEQLSYGMLP